MSTSAFTPTGNTVTFTAATVAPTAVQALSTTLGGNQYRILNTGNVTVFMGVGANAALANANGGSLIVGAGNGTATIPLLSGTDEILTFLPNAWFTGQVASNTCVVYITCGDGM